ncbi:hypothetical protein C8J57DRAFT_1224536 [Mycena rebaudengoi]|nr:hypothetical protein C8J57DRAFT_1224536 [Mycena rebaudengoi]
MQKTLDFLCDDLQALRACSEVCRAWLPSSRYHLWRMRTLYLGRGGDYRPIRLLSDPLSTLVPVVRRVGIGDIWKPSHVLHLVQVIARCRSVLYARTQSLSLKEMLWKDIDEASRTLFISSFGNLTELIFSNMKFGSFGDMAGLLVSFPNLQSLSLIRVGWNGRLPSLDSDSPSLHLNLPQLRTLNIDHGSRDIAEWLRIGDNTFPRLEKARLKIFKIPPSLHFDRLQSLDIDLSRNMALRKIHISHIQLLRPGTYPLPNMGWVLRALASVTSPFIHTIQFTIFINDVANINQMEWDSMRVILNRPQFGSMQTLLLEMYGNLSAAERAELEIKVFEALGGTRAANILLFFWH